MVGPWIRGTPPAALLKWIPGAGDEAYEGHTVISRVYFCLDLHVPTYSSGL